MDDLNMLCFNENNFKIFFETFYINLNIDPIHKQETSKNQINV